MCDVANCVAASGFPVSPRDHSQFNPPSSLNFIAGLLCLKPDGLYSAFTPSITVVGPLHIAAMASQHGNGPSEEKDVAEVKKAIATGASTKEAPLSAREFHFTLEILNNNDIWSTVPPILCYCCASILMTVVNKVLL